MSGLLVDRAGFSFVVLSPSRAASTQQFRLSTALVARAGYWNRFCAGESDACIVHFEDDDQGLLGGQFERMVLAAAQRCAHRSPTVKKFAAATGGAFDVVGVFDLRAQRLRVVDAPGLLAWAPHASAALELAA